MNEPHFLCLAVVISTRDYTQTKDNHVTNVMVSGIKMTETGLLTSFEQLLNC